MGVWVKTWNRAVVFLGPGGFQVFPQCVSGLVPPPVCLLAEQSCSVPDLALGSPWGGGEVRNTKAARSERPSAGRRGGRDGNAARSARTRERCGERAVCAYCVGSVQGPALTKGQSSGRRKAIRLVLAVATPIDLKIAYVANSGGEGFLEVARNFHRYYLPEVSFTDELVFAFEVLQILGVPLPG